jgi:hypothetical protein
MRGTSSSSLPACSTPVGIHTMPVRGAPGAVVLGALTTPPPSDCAPSERPQPPSTTATTPTTPAPAAPIYSALSVAPSRSPSSFIFS